MSQSRGRCFPTNFGTIAALVLLFAGLAVAGENNRKNGGPEVVYPLGFTVSAPVRSMPPAAFHAVEKQEKLLHHPPRKPSTTNLPDPVVQTSAMTAAATSSGSQWEGLGYGFPNFTIVGVPPDTNMAVGPNHIVQWVNGGFAVFDKQGHSIYAVDDSTFWGNSTCNQLGGYSDPVVQYDKVADRWLVGEVAIPLWPGLIGQFAQCLAVSETNDPTGAYYMWAYGFGTDVNDYPKIGMWPDAYYITWNIFDYNSGNFLYPEACAWDRQAATGGASSPALVCFKPSNVYASFLPSDWDGATAPPVGSPNFLMDVDTGTGALHLWRFHVDFVHTANSTLSGPISLGGVATFTSPCPTTQDCIPQPGTTQKLDSLSDRLMYRLAYRNFGDHESLVLNHSVVADDASYGSRVGVRWYEVRSPNGTPAIYQQGTFAPDGDNRWMGSIAQDSAGDIAVGYSVASAATFPSIRFTGQQVGEPAGTLESETTLVAGGGSQTAYNRWGDYSAMRIDPGDDCTFWYTTEYYQTTQGGNWYTRVGSFKFPSCGGVTKTATNTSLVSSPNPSTLNQQVTLTATVTPAGATGTVTFYDGSTSLGTGSLSGSGQATLQTSSLSLGTHNLTAAYGGDASYGASSSGVYVQTVSSASLGTTSTAITGSSPSSPVYGQTVTFTAQVSSSGGTPTGTVTFNDGTTTLGSASVNSSGVATFSTSSLSGGTHSITADYSGDSNFSGSTSVGYAITIAAATTSTTVTSNRNPAKTKQPVTFTATVTPSAATGQVQFLDGTTVLGTSPLGGGTASFSLKLSVGTHSIMAKYMPADGNYGASSDSMIETVTK